MLSITTESEPINVIRAWVVVMDLVPGFVWVAAVVSVEEPLDVQSTLGAAEINDIFVSFFISFRTLVSRISLISAAVKDTGPGEPISVHFDAPGDEERGDDFFCFVSPVDDVGVALAVEDIEEGETIGGLFLFVRFIPWGPKDERDGAVACDDLDVFGRE